jgi:hypothetical protein
MSANGPALLVNSTNWNFLAEFVGMAAIGASSIVVGFQMRWAIGIRSLFGTN